MQSWTMEESMAESQPEVKMVNGTSTTESDCSKSINSHSCICHAEAGETTPLLSHTYKHSGEQNSNTSQEQPTRRRMTKRQIALLITIAYGHFWISTCYSLLAPFFPAEAVKKGASPTVYGFIFGVFQLTFFISSPIFGKIMPVATCRFLIISGIFVCSVCSLLFGVLYYAPSGLPFIITSFAVRIVEALGNSAYSVAALTATSAEFAENRATVVSLLESVAGTGMIIGPTVGGALYEAGGYTLPFFVLGGILFLGSIVAIVVVPNTEQQEELGNLWGLLKKAKLYIYWIIFAYCFCVIGFIEATLSVHLSPFHFKPVILGLIFIIPGGIYALGSPVWGILCDKGVKPEMCCLIGNVLVTIAFLFLGPVPFLGLSTKIWMVIMSLGLLGTGLGAMMISCFVLAINNSINEGLPVDVSTYSLVSGAFTSVGALGAFIGPSAGGVMLDHIGYNYSTLVFFGMSLLMTVVCNPNLLTKVVPGEPDAGNHCSKQTYHSLHWTTVFPLPIELTYAQIYILDSENNKNIASIQYKLCA